MIIVVAVIVGVAAGALTFHAHHSGAEAVLAGGGAFAGALMLLNRIVS